MLVGTEHELRMARIYGQCCFYASQLEMTHRTWKLGARSQWPFYRQLLRLGLSQSDISTLFEG
jgi:hypothetical protein